MTGQPNDYEHRAEGESTFEWPLDSAGMRMSAGELLDSLLATHPASQPHGRMATDHTAATLDGRDGRPGTPPDLAVCLWKRKPAKNHKEG